MSLPIDLAKLNFQFSQKPLIIGGMAMQYYGLRQSGADIDLVIGADDHARLWEQYPDHRKELWGDLGVCLHEFEIWDSICLFDYAALSPGAVDAGDYLIIAPEKLLLLKALGMRVPKYQHDLELLVDYINGQQYATLYAPKIALHPSPQPFVGTWELDPDPAQTVYQHGAPPRQGVYIIAYDGHQLHFDMQWTTAEGAERSQQIDVIPNGREQPYENPAVADTVCYTPVDQFTLDSTATKQGRVVAYARRVLSPNGNTMTITQSGTTSKGAHFENRSVYRRVKDVNADAAAESAGSPTTDTLQGAQE
jgi:hypothetical protein